MRRQGQGVLVLARLLLVACLFWALSLHSPPSVQAQAVGSVHPKARPYSLETARLYPGHMGPGLGKEKKMRKSPSGPNPTGNHRPPTRH